jgi:hypothetical protein
VNSQFCGITVDCTSPHPSGVPTFENPYGSSLVEPTGKANSVIVCRMHVRWQITTQRILGIHRILPVSLTPPTPTPLYLGVYARNNKLPYTMNSHARHSVAAPQRPGDRYRLRECPRASRNHSYTFQSTEDRDSTNPLCGPAATCPNPSAPVCPDLHVWLHRAGAGLCYLCKLLPQRFAQRSAVLVESRGRQR